METNLYRKIGLQIKQAREKLGISQEELAKTLDRDSAATISHYEAGQRKISIVDLQKIASSLGYPLEYFLDSNLEEEMSEYYLRASVVPPVARGEVANFLALASQHGIAEENIWKGGTYRNKIEELVSQNKIEELVSQILKFAEFTEPPIDLYKLANKINIPIFDWDFPNEISGMLAIEENQKVSIGVNRSHPTVRQRFTIAHELGHYFFRGNKNLYLDFHEAALQPYEHDTVQKLEMQANKFAASLLMPKGWVEKDFIKFGEVGHYLLAQRYQVSEQAMWIRLTNLGLVREN